MDGKLVHIHGTNNCDVWGDTKSMNGIEIDINAKH
jgi:hypothetical protein